MYFFSCALMPSFNQQRLFYGFLVVHLVIWTLIPFIGRYSLHHDVLEGISQGMQYQLGYSKHPFLSMWLVATVWNYMGQSDLVMYFLSQLIIGIGFYYIWKLSCCILTAEQALLATLLTDGLMAFNFDANVLTPDTCQIPCWAAIGYYCYQVILKPTHTRSWFILGTLFGIGFLIKYQIIFLLLPISLLFLFEPTLRQTLLTKQFCYALLTFGVTISPHIFWMYSHQFQNLAYSEQSISSHQNLTLFSIVKNYLANTMAVCAGVLGLFAIGTFQTQKMSRNQNPIQKHFITTLAFGPWLMTLLFAIVAHTDVMARWMTPYYCFLGCFLCYYVAPLVEFKQIKNIFILYTIGAIGFTGLSIGHLVFNPHCDAMYPNKEIATFLETQWQAQQQGELPYIGGNRYLVSSVIPYIKALPKPFFSLDLKTNPWINLSDFQKKGGIVAWDLDGNYAWDIESALQGRRPEQTKVLTQLPQHILYHTFYTEDKHRPIQIAYVVIPPKQP